MSNLVNGRCCSQPPAEPNYTVCFPNQQVIPDTTTRPNPYYDFAAQVSYWTYLIQVDLPTTPPPPGPPNMTDLSHWNIQMCCPLIEREEETDFSVEVSEDGGVTFRQAEEIELLPGGDPSIDGVTCVLKIDEGQPTGTSWVYRIAILNPDFFNLQADPGTVEIKHGAFPEPGFQIFNAETCGLVNVPLTPSIFCTLVEPPPEPLVRMRGF